VSYDKFIDSDCAALATKMSDTRAELEKSSKMQDSKVRQTAMRGGVFLLGIPFSKLSGNHQGDVARLGGRGY
jgi:hypothetical protein